MNQHRSLQPFNKPDERHKKRECTTEYTLFFIYIIISVPLKWDELNN